MAQKKKVRLSDIAEKLGISTVTVSKALSDKDGVGDELRQQIKEIAVQMDYQVKRTNISGADGSTTGNIGILIPSRFFSPDVSYYWHIFNALSSELLNHGYYSIMELLSDDDENTFTLPRMIKDKKIDGLIVLGQTKDSYLEALSSQVMYAVRILEIRGYMPVNEEYDLLRRSSALTGYITDPRTIGKEN